MTNRHSWCVQTHTRSAKCEFTLLVCPGLVRRQVRKVRLDRRLQVDKYKLKLFARKSHNFAQVLEPVPPEAELPPVYQMLLVLSAQCRRDYFDRPLNKFHPLSI